MTDTAGPEDYAYCADLVRQGDPDRFACLMLADEMARRHLCALYAFNLEVARTREAVREALLGEIRLQWWRDAIAECYEGTPRRHQVVQPLKDAIDACGLPRQMLDEIVDARAADLYPEPPVSSKALRDYVTSTGGLIGGLAERCAGNSSDASFEAGQSAGEAWAWLGLARGLLLLHGQGRRIVPGEWAAPHGSLEDELETGRIGEGIRAVVSKFTAEAELALDRFHEGQGPSKTSRHTRAIVRLASVYRRRLDNAGYDPTAAGCASLGTGARAWYLLGLGMFGRR